MPEQRLQKILAQSGVASRRGAEKLISAGKVTVDGKLVTEMGAKADPARQRIEVDGKPLPRTEALEYWLVHKPVGVVCTLEDPQGRKLVVDMLPPEVKSRLYPVGRLDLNSEGLVLLTNDGDLANHLMHPKYEVPKRYLVWVDGRPTAAVLDRLRKGVDLDGRPTAPARVGVKSANAKSSKLSFVLNEGRKREIRLMCQAVGLRVKRLLRTAIGPITLGNLPAGAARRLSGYEVEVLKKATGLLTGCKASVHGVKKSPQGKYPRAKAKKPRRRRDSP
jgi:23S rRNA pseudouridine2605 synthase